MSVLNDDAGAALEHLFGSDDKLRLAIAITDRAFEEAARRPTPDCPAWCTLPPGHRYEPREIGPSSSVQREHTMIIHEEINGEPFDAVIAQVEIQYNGGKFERKMPCARVRLNTQTLSWEALSEVAKTVAITAENLRLIQQ